MIYQTLLTDFRIAIFILAFLFTSSANGQSKYDYTDGPYITVKRKKTEVKWVQNGKPQYLELDKKESYFDKEGLPKVDLQLLRDYDLKSKYREQYDASKIIAISDIHGQHDLCIDLLKANKVINDELEWIFGDGHLVVVGDVFDRGPKVTETLWFLVHLEAQAKEAGGLVHMLLGNHELLIIHGEMKYLNPKYRYTCGALKSRYQDLFSDETFLGEWLASKNITVTINDILFVHGGISRKFVRDDISFKKLNKTYRPKLVSYDENSIFADSTLTNIYLEEGPLWYRGYAEEVSFMEEEADFILDKIKRKHIVVGHTSSPKIISLFQNKVLLIDSSIKFGKEGEILIIEDNKFYACDLDGEKILLD